MQYATLQELKPQANKVTSSGEEGGGGGEGKEGEGEGIEKAQTSSTFV